MAMGPVAAKAMGLSPLALGPTQDLSRFSLWHSSPRSTVPAMPNNNLLDWCKDLPQATPQKFHCNLGWRSQGFVSGSAEPVGPGSALIRCPTAELHHFSKAFYGNSHRSRNSPWALSRIWTLSALEAKLAATILPVNANILNQFVLLMCRLCHMLLALLLRRWNVTLPPQLAGRNTDRRHL